MKRTSILVCIVVCLFTWEKVNAHPGSGIVVDRRGNVYFIDTAAGVWKIDSAGTITKISRLSFHWLAIDPEDQLANTPLTRISSQSATVTRVATGPTLFVSSDFPITVAPGGNLYYPWARRGERAKVFRMDATGTVSPFHDLPPAGPEPAPQWRNGIAASADGSIWYTEDRAIRKISRSGVVSTVIEDPGISDCGTVPGLEPAMGPYYRGLAVDADGTVFVAASGCRSVLRITPDGKVTTILQTSGAWSPTAVAVHGGAVYVLEYIHTADENRPGWIPRVRKVFTDGSIVTLATIDRS